MEMVNGPRWIGRKSTAQNKMVPVVHCCSWRLGWDMGWHWHNILSLSLYRLSFWMLLVSIVSWPNLARLASINPFPPQTKIKNQNSVSSLKRVYIAPKLMPHICSTIWTPYPWSCCQCMHWFSSIFKSKNQW